MSAWARPGVKCVCVTDCGWTVSRFDDEPAAGPSLNDQLTIRAVGEDEGGPWLEFVEWTAPDDQFHTHHKGAPNFRPLISQSDDVALIKSLLISNPVDAGLVPAGVEFSV